MPIDCPYCGLRPIEEFAMRGDAGKLRPDSVDLTAMDNELAAQWHDYVYLRDNPKGLIEEYWHHVAGCRSWLVVTRNTATHDVASVVSASEHTKAKRSTDGHSPR